jgi:hypothetical protein
MSQAAMGRTNVSYILFSNQLESNKSLQGAYMCRSIKQLRNSEIPATEDEIHAAALQFVRKVSGYRKPSKLNQATFEKAVEDVADATQRLLAELRQPQVQN